MTLSFPPHSTSRRCVAIGSRGSRVSMLAPNTHTHSCCANTTLHGTDRKETLITARDVRRVMEEDVRLSQSPFLYRSLQHTMKGVE